MRRKDMPFVVYRRGPGSFTIIPRGLKGWAQFAVWLALLLPLVLWFADHAPPQTAGEFAHYGLVLFVIGLLAWFASGIWWMLARGEVIDVVELQRDRQRARRKVRRQD